MNKKTLIVSTLAAVLIVLASLSSVIGTNIVKSDAKKSIASPLFAVRTQRSLDLEEAKKISANYLGKGKQLSILLPKKSMAQVWIDKAIKIFDRNPVLIDKLLERLDKTPYIAKMLNKHDVTKQDIKNYIRIIKNNPSTLTKEIENIQMKISIENNIPQPQNLETDNLGCVIIPIVLAPVAVIITLLMLLFTLRVLTCLNVNECGDEILQGIWESLLQGLTEG
ncbi:MAG: hypothetical protein JSW06_00350 [Thermoplasmatales archaeon]|nr:MAG: hypothetical protein JSW06_00350 [Thermoplasmatales archaeon]